MSATSAGLVAAQRRVEPALREENVAGLLDLPQHVQARLHVLLRRLGAQRMMQVARALRAPTARAAGCSRPCSDRNHCSRSAGSAESAGITNWNRALRSGFSMRASCVFRMSLQPSTCAHGELQRQRGVIGFGQRQAGDGLLLLPDLPQPRHGPGRHRDVAQRAEPRRFLARRRRRAPALRAAAIRTARRARRARRRSRKRHHVFDA